MKPKPGELKFVTKNDGYVHIHPSSVNYQVISLPCTRAHIHQLLRGIYAQQLVSNPYCGSIQLHICKSPCNRLDIYTGTVLLSLCLAHVELLSLEVIQSPCLTLLNVSVMD